MLNLIKYEFIKQRGSKMIAAGIYIVLEICFLIGALFEIDNLLGMSMGFLAIVSIAFLFWLGIEAIFTLAGDMKNKSGYLLFMTPHSVYKILAGKIVCAIITIIIAVAAISLIAVGDFTILVVRFSSIKELSEMISGMFEALFSIELNWQYFLIIVCEIIFSWICTVAIGFLAVTVSSTLLANAGARGLISFVLFIAINLLVSFITNGLMELINTNSDMIPMMIPLVIAAVTTVICFIASGECMKRYLAL